MHTGILLELKGCISLSDHSCGTSLNPKTLQLKMAAITELIRSEQSPSTPTHHTGLEEKNLQLLLDLRSSAPAASSPHGPTGLRVSYMCMYCILFTILYQQLKGIYRPVQTSCLCALDSSEKGEELQEKHFVGVLPLTTTTWHAGNSKCCCRPG